jgi:hypothetical protein
VGKSLILVVVEWSGMLTTLCILRLVHLVAAYSDGVFVFALERHIDLDFVLLGICTILILLIH